jgi:hypothetical protein
VVEEEEKEEGNNVGGFEREKTERKPDILGIFR